MTVERNIHYLSGKFRVLITRRPKNVYGGRFSTVEEARTVRNRLELSIKPLPPWGQTPRKVKRRSMQDLRMERRRKGLCQACGDEAPKVGCVMCQSCLEVQNQKRINQRKEICQLKAELTSTACNS